MSNWLAVRDQMTGASRTVKVVVPRALAINWTVEEIKADPLSLWRERGSPNLGMISCKSFFATSEAFSVWVGKASIHPVKMSIKTRTYDLEKGAFE